MVGCVRETVWLSGEAIDSQCRLRVRTVDSDSREGRHRQRSYVKKTHNSSREAKLSRNFIIHKQEVRKKGKKMPTF